MKTYIQIGANIGNDYFQKQIETLIEPSLVVLVEPNKRLIEQLKLNYKFLETKHTIIICNKAIALREQKAKLYVYAETGHSSLIKRKSHMQPLEELDIESISFNDLCKQYDIDKIELLQIDTEGLDYEIVNSIDFSKITIKTLLFEHWVHQNDDLNNVYKTGPEFFETQLKPSLLKLYDWSPIHFEGGPNHKFTLKK